MRTRATYVPPLRSQPRQIPDQLQMHRIRYAHVHARLCTPCRHHVHVYVCRNEAFLQLRMAVRVLRVAVRVLGVALYFNSTVTFFLFLLRGLGGTPFEV